MMGIFFYDIGSYILIFLWMHYFSKCRFRSKKIAYMMPLFAIMISVCKNAVGGMAGVILELALLLGVATVLFKEKIWNTMIRAVFVLCYTDLFELPLDTILYILKYYGIDYTNNYYIMGISFYVGIAILILLNNKFSKATIFHYTEGLYANKYYYIGILIGFSASGIRAYLRLLMDENIKALSIFMFVLLSIMIAMVYFLGISIFLLDTVRMQYKKELAFKNEYLTMTQEYYQNLERQMLEIRKIRHEMNQHLNAIQYYIEGEEYIKASRYIQETGCQIAKVEKSVNVGNELLNISISHLKKLYDAKLKCEGCVGEEIPVNEGELCIIVVNLLKNAMEYCETSKAQDGEIILRFREFQSHLVVHCENPVEEEIDVELLGTYSSKKEKLNHGLGILNVKDIVEKYEGELSFSCEDGIFSADIIL